MTTTASSVAAIAFRRQSTLADSDCLVDVEIACPAPGPHDLRVAVRAVSVNPVDTKIRAGQVATPDSVRCLGWDAAGIVEAVGEAVTLFRPGDAVYYAGSFDRTGSNAHSHLVDERIVGRAPASLSFAEAAALPLTALTAWQLLFDRLGVPPGKPAGAGSLLVLGGAGGVGSMLIQLARRLTGLTVVATASRAQSRDWCLALGAHHVIDHRQPLPAQVSALPVPPITHIAALSNTAEHWAELAELIAPQGRLAIIDDHDTLDAVPFKAKSVSLHWEMVFTRPLFGTPDLIAQHRILDEVAALVDAGVLRSTVNRVLVPLDAARLRDAHRLVEGGGMTGKVVVARAAEDTMK
ncbi:MULTISPECIES: zinc-binding alcohol dehydrogenase family protein [Burkholderia cepacia complex]|uniref:zinc-binding alcohol dehydrogenase family protein n=1 Tax=Burkholderia cepacia complex TaxID=87882 RepID=UPI000F07FD44|nr:MULTISPECIES: zinc-binding alcohol dehydrogenase family protein [Burkholderia cepacia complex]AYQ44466.1 zinc-binding alcohol dehydrogenase family protein [Burkholderia lata]